MCHPRQFLNIRLEDAFPIGYLGREFQSLITYERNHKSQDGFQTQLRPEYGFPRNGQIRVTVPFWFGEIKPTGLGDVRGELFYNFNQETIWLPAVAAVAGIRTPMGKESRGLNPSPVSS